MDKKALKEQILKILDPLKPYDKTSSASSKVPFQDKRSAAGRLLPEYYLLYFLFSDLLGFKNNGQFEKVAWSFPLDYNGRGFLLDYRKFGVGLFTHGEEADEIIAQEIVDKIKRAVKMATAFYDTIAEEAVSEAKISVVNRNRELHNRFEYLLKLYKKERAKYEKHKDVIKKKVHKTDFGESTSYTNVGYKYLDNSNWLAISTIEAFFSWTEHLFIHLAIIGRQIHDGTTIATLIGAEWKTKFNTVFPIQSSQLASKFNELLIVRQQLRNFVAHGAFGKNGNAFMFHSGTGAVPVIMEHKKTKNRFSLHGELSFREDDVIKLIEDFIELLWNTDIKPAMEYTQKYQLPTIVPYAKDGTYKTAMESSKKMKSFCDGLIMQFDNAANMDW